MSWTRKISHANEMLKKGTELTCKVLSVDQERKRIALGLKQLGGDPWETDIPVRYKVNTLVKGKVTKITNFGVFVELESELEGLLHVSELADHKIENPETVCKVGDEIEVRVLRVDIDDRKIGLSKKLAPEPVAESKAEARAEAQAQQSQQSAQPKELKGGIGGGSGGGLFSMPTAAAAIETPTAE